MSLPSSDHNDDGSDEAGLDGGYDDGNDDNYHGGGHNYYGVSNPCEQYSDGLWTQSIIYGGNSS